MFTFLLPHFFSHSAYFVFSDIYHSPIFKKIYIAMCLFMFISYAYLVDMCHTQWSCLGCIFRWFSGSCVLLPFLYGLFVDRKWKWKWKLYITLEFSTLQLQHMQAKHGGSFININCLRRWSAEVIFRKKTCFSRIWFTVGRGNLWRFSQFFQYKSR